MTQLLGDVELVTKQELEAALDATVIPESDIDDKIQAVKDSAANDLASQKEVLESEISLVDSKVSTEATARQDADNMLTNKVDNEAQIRETSDNALQTRIEREEGVRQAADDQVIELVNAETTERKASEHTLQESIEALSVKIDPEVSQLTQLITDEEQARITADTTLTDTIDNIKAKVEALPDIESGKFEDTVICVRMSNLPLAQMTVENHDRTIAVGDIIGTVGSRYLPKIPVTFSFIAELSDASYNLTARLNANGEITVIDKTKFARDYVGNVDSVTVMYITKE